MRRWVKFSAFSHSGTKLKYYRTVSASFIMTIKRQLNIQTQGTARVAARPNREKSKASAQMSHRRVTNAAEGGRRQRLDASKRNTQDNNSILDHRYERRHADGSVGWVLTLHEEHPASSARNAICRRKSMKSKAKSLRHRRQTGTIAWQWILKEIKSKAGFNRDF